MTIEEFTLKLRKNKTKELFEALPKKIKGFELTFRFEENKQTYHLDYTGFFLKEGWVHYDDLSRRRRFWEDRTFYKYDSMEYKTLKHIWSFSGYHECVIGMIWFLYEQKLINMEFSEKGFLIGGTTNE